MIDWLRRKLANRPTEHRSYSTLLLAGAEATAAGTGHATAAWSKSAALEIAAGWWSRGLALATVEPANRRTAALTPRVLSTVGRRLARDGEALYRLDVAGGRLVLREAWQWDVTGDADPAGWQYRLTEPGPSRTRTRIEPAAGVLHVRYAWLPSTPWAGLSPGAAAAHGAGLAGGIDRQMSGEAAGPSGYVMPAPDRGDGASEEDDPLSGLRSDLLTLRGGLTVAPTMKNPAEAASPTEDYKVRRFGFDPPQRLVDVRRLALADMLHAYGIAPVLVDERASAAAFREAVRVFWNVTMPALGALVSEQAAEALDVPDLALTFPAPGDVAVRAGAVRALCAAGMDLAEARAVVRL